MFAFTGADQTFVVPVGVTSVTIKAWGAGGGGAGVGAASTAGGAGFASGDLAVTPGESLTVIVGGGGQPDSTAATYGGGGPGGNDTSVGNFDGSSGGGRSAVRRGGTELLTAGGGGGSAGATASNPGSAFAENGAGAGGGTDGQDVVASGCTTGAASGGTQNAGGTGGAGVPPHGGSDGVQFAGGAGGLADAGNTGAGGGGGGGYFGGGGGAGQNISIPSCGAAENLPFGQETPGAGGSGFVGGVTNGTPIGGDRTTVANTGDPDYQAGIGAAGANQSPGGNGLVVILYDSAEPGLSIVKSTTTTDLPPLGEPIPYTFVVTNTGNVILEDIEVSDPNTTEMTCPSTSLEPDESMSCTAEHVVTESDVDAGVVTNQAEVVGTPLGGNPIPPVTSNETTVPGEPELTLDKTSNPETVSEAGESVTYMFTATNTGNATLTNVQPTEIEFDGAGELSPIECPPEAAALTPGQQVTCTATYEVEQADIDAGGFTNVAVVTAIDEEDNIISSDPAEETVDSSPPPPSAPSPPPSPPPSPQLPFTGVDTSLLWVAVVLIGVGVRLALSPRRRMGPTKPE